MRRALWIGLIGLLLAAGIFIVADFRSMGTSPVTFSFQGFDYHPPRIERFHIYPGLGPGPGIHPASRYPTFEARNLTGRRWEIWLYAFVQPDGKPATPFFELRTEEAFIASRESKAITLSGGVPGQGVHPLRVCFRLGRRRNPIMKSIYAQLRILNLRWHHSLDRLIPPDYVECVSDPIRE